MGPLTYMTASVKSEPIHLVRLHEIFRLQTVETHENIKHAAVVKDVLVGD